MAGTTGQIQRLLGVAERDGSADVVRQDGEHAFVIGSWPQDSSDRAMKLASSARRQRVVADGPEQRVDEREAARETGDGGDEARLLGRLQRLYRVLNGSIRRGRDERGVERCPDDYGDVEHVQFGSCQPVVAGDEQAGHRPWATVGAHGLEGEQRVAICSGVNFSGGNRGRLGRAGRRLRPR